MFHGLGGPMVYIYIYYIYNTPLPRSQPPYTISIQTCSQGGAWCSMSFLAGGASPMDFEGMVEFQGKSIHYLEDHPS